MADWTPVSQEPIQSSGQDWTPVSHEPIPQSAASDNWTPVSQEPLEQQEPPERSWGEEIGRDIRTGLRGVLPAIGAGIGTVAGGLGGAAAGSAVPLVGTAVGGFAGGLGGGIAGGIVADQVQNKLADAMGIDSEAQRQADASNPTALSTAAGIAPALVAFSPGSLATKLSQRVLTGGVLGAVNVGTQELTKGKVDPTEAAIAAGTGALLPNVRGPIQKAGGAVAEAVQSGLGRGWGGGSPPGGAAVNRAAEAVNPPLRATERQDAAVSPPTTSPAAGVAPVHAPAPDSDTTAPPGTTDAVAKPDEGMTSVRSDRDYPKGPKPAEGGVQLQPSTPLETLNPAQGGMTDSMAATIRGQQGEGPNAQINEKAPPQPAPPPPAAEQGAPPPEQAPQAPGTQIPEDLSIPPFLRRTAPGVEPTVKTPPEGQTGVEPTVKTPPEGQTGVETNPNEGVQQQAQQRQPPNPPAAPQAEGESDNEFAARIAASQRQNAQNAPGGRQPGAPFNLADATKKVEQLNGDTVKDQPAGAQAAIDAADATKGRVPLRTRNAVEKWLANSFLGKTFNPTGVDESGAYFKKSARSNLGEIQQRLDQFEHAFSQPIRDIFDNLTPEQGHEIQRALQDPNPMERLSKWPELEPAVRELRNQIKADAAFKVQKGSLDPEQIERDHFPQLWKDPKAADDFLDNWYARQGSKAGFKSKVHPTIADGEASGLQLKYDNPIDPVASRMRSDYRYQMGNSMLQDAMRDGIVTREERPGTIPLAARLNGIDTKLYAPEGYATSWNNHFGAGFRDTPAGRAFMDLAQPATAWSRSMLLGLSPFHGITMLNEAWISQMKLGLQTMARDPVEGAKILAASPLGGKTLYSAGKGAQKASVATSIDPDSPYAKTVPLLRKANARFTGNQAGTFEFNPGPEAKALAPAPAETIMQSFSNAFKEAKTDITTDFKDAKGNPIQLGKATLKAVGTAMQAVSHPLFGEIIPAMKAGAAHMELGEWLRQHPEADEGAQHDMAMRIWDDVENRFGMMTHDNLFWNNKLKEGMQIGMTSPTWTTGFIKNFGGGLARGVMHPSRALMGSKDYDPNISSALTLGMTVALTSGIYQYLKTGKPPGSVYDLMAGQTGGKTNMGQPERAILPGFQKDVYGWFHDPINEAYNKVGPLPKALIETATNKGWTQTPKGPRYGPISNANDPFWKQVYDRGAHLAHSIEPISFQQLTKVNSKGTNISTAERAAAIREAPKYINPGGNPAEKAAAAREYKKTHPNR